MFVRVRVRVLARAAVLSNLYTGGVLTSGGDRRHHFAQPCSVAIGMPGTQQVKPPFSYTLTYKSTPLPEVCKDPPRRLIAVLHPASCCSTSLQGLVPSGTAGSGAATRDGRRWK